jgi:hypothetical protein
LQGSIKNRWGEGVVMYTTLTGGFKIEGKRR